MRRPRRRRGVAGDPVGTQRAGGGPDGIGQDVRGVPRRDGSARQGRDRGRVARRDAVVYVSPLKALSNDIQRNLEAPLEGIGAELAALGLPEVPIRAMVRTGDMPQGERARMRRTPPHILVTTPESLYILLTSVSGREMLSTCRTVIVDEIHAIAGNKRGAHLALSLERLEAAGAGRPPVTRIGLSATQKPIEEVARFLVGAPRMRRGPARGGIAASSMPVTRGGAISRSRCRRRRSKRSCRARCGPGLRSPRRARARAPHHAGVRQHAPPGRARRAAFVGAGRARSTSPRTTAVSPAIGGWTPSSA
jgi:hypothetical protein